MLLSKFGEKFTSQSGILSLMEDLGNALAGNDSMIMMGGGNPAHIPEVEKIFRQRLQGILESQAEFTRLIGTYAPPPLAIRPFARIWPTCCSAALAGN